MIAFEKALDIVLSKTNQLNTEIIHLHDCNGRILASDIKSDLDFPPFNKAAMDGFALKEEDSDKELTIVDTIAAGQIPTKTINNGETAKIMTGAPVPEGADYVIQVELSEQIADTKVKFTKKPKNNIIYKAEQLKAGEKVLSKGELIDARHIAVLSAVGQQKVEVYKKPIVGIISTGDELVEPDHKPNLAQIRNSNGHQLVSQTITSGAIPKYYGIVEDTYEATYAAIEKGLNECDILLLTGGVSMGEFDFVPKIMKDIGIQIHFDRVAVKPGKPTTFGTYKNKYIFGLPGNPVSSYIQFDILVKPLIYKTMGHNYQHQITRLPLGENYNRKNADRLAHIPVKIIDNNVLFTSYKGSSHINGLIEKDGIVELQIGENALTKGDFVDVRLF